MDFTLAGFSQESGYRLFAFESISAERIKTRYQVKVDISLLGKYGIKIQELPLLCRRFLEEHEKDIGKEILIFTESEMSLQQSERTAAIQANALKRKTMYKPSSAAGTAWRTFSSK